MQITKRSVTISFVFVIMTTALALGGKNLYEKRQKNITTIRLINKKIVRSFTVYTEANGQLQADTERYLTLKNGGRLDKLFVRQGEVVKQGDFIASIDENIRKTALQSALTAFKLASKDLGRMQRLARQGAATSKEIESAREHRDASRARLEEAKSKLLDGVVRAPINGTIALIAFTVGDVIPDASRIGIIQDPQSVSLQFKVAVKFRPYLKAQTNLVMSHHHNHSIHVSGVLTPPSPKHDYDGGFIDLHFALDQLPKGFNIGDDVKIKLPITTYPEATLIPIAALRWHQGHATVITLGDDSRLVRQQVKTGFPQGGWIPLLNFDHNAQVVDPLFKNVTLLIEKKQRVRLALDHGSPKSKNTANIPPPNSKIKGSDQ